MYLCTSSSASLRRSEFSSLRWMSAFFIALASDANNLALPNCGRLAVVHSPDPSSALAAFA